MDNFQFMILELLSLNAKKDVDLTEEQLLESTLTYVEEVLLEGYTVTKGVK